MEIAKINMLGWFFLISLAIFVAGVLLHYVNRSMVELAARLDRSEEAPKYSYWQAWLLPRYRAGLGRHANEEFHTSVDKKAQNGLVHIALMLIVSGAALQACLWIYVYNFAGTPVSFINP